MPAPKLPDAQTLKRLRSKGWTYKMIGDEYGVTVPAVQKKLARYNAIPIRKKYTDILPWRIELKHQGSGTMRRFRSIIKQENGVKLTDEEARRLDYWLRGLEEMNVVVAYHPDAPPNAASSSGGFYYVPRLPSDTWIIREPSDHQAPE